MMAERTSRRAVLATLAAGASSGCLNFQQTEDAPNASTTDRPATATDGDTATDTATDAATDATTESRTQTPGRGDAGEERWSYRVRAPFDHGERALVTDGDAVYAAPTDNRLYALDAATGSVRWQREFQPANLTLAGDRLYAASLSLDSLVALTPESGESIWSRSLRARHPPLVDDGTVYVAQNGASAPVSAHDAETGETQWTYEHETEAVTGQPAVENGVFCFAAAVGRTFPPDETVVHGVDAETGEELWRHETTEKPFLSPVAATSSLAFVVGSTESGIKALDLETGSVAWERDDAVSGATPHVVDGTLLVAGNRAYGLDPSTGETRWDFHGGEGFHSLVPTETTVVGLKRDGGVVEFEPDTGETTAEYDSGVGSVIRPAVGADAVTVGSTETSDVVSVWRPT